MILFSSVVADNEDSCKQQNQDEMLYKDSFIGFAWYAYDRLLGHLHTDSDNALFQHPIFAAKYTFPVIGHAAYGYDIRSGYPLADGMDPGFKRPIFAVTYNRKQMTGDYSKFIPDGFHALESVACTTSFSSDIMTSTKQLSNSLATKAEASGGAYGASFSASAGFKQASSKLSSGESVFITSSASCTYYKTIIDVNDPPTFHPGFLSLVKQVMKKEKHLEELKQMFGTHYAKEIDFGARYTHIHEMSSSNYQSMTSNNKDIAASASYAGVASVSGSFSLEHEQSEEAREFSTKVKTTTSSVGATPPANGDAMTWASSVKESPLPVKYKLEPIEKLFTGSYLKNIVSGGMKKDIEKLVNDALKGDSADEQTEIILPGIKLDTSQRSRKIDQASCVSYCKSDPDCIAVVYSPPKETGQTQTDPTKKNPTKTDPAKKDPSKTDQTKTDVSNCYYSDLRTPYIHLATFENEQGFTTIIYPDKMKSGNDFKIMKATVPSIWIAAYPAEGSEQCEEKCRQDHGCRVFTYCNPKLENSWCKSSSVKDGENRDQTKNNCFLYDEITKLMKDDFSELMFPKYREK